MRVALPNHLLGVIQVTSSDCIPERADKHLSHSTSAAVGSKIVVFRMVDIDLCSFREPLEDRPCAVCCDRRRPNILVERQQEVSGIPPRRSAIASGVPLDQLFHSG